MYPGKKWCYGLWAVICFCFRFASWRERRFVWWSIKFFPSCPEFRTMLSVTVEMDKIWTNYELLESTCNLYSLIWSLLPHLSGVLNDRCETVDLDFWQKVFEQTWFVVLSFFTEQHSKSWLDHFFLESSLSLWNRRNLIDVMVAWPQSMIMWTRRRRSSL